MVRVDCARPVFVQTYAFQAHACFLLKGKVKDLKALHITCMNTFERNKCNIRVWVWYKGMSLDKTC